MLSTNSCTRRSKALIAAPRASARAGPAREDVDEQQPARVGIALQRLGELAQRRLRGVGPAARAGVRRPDGQQALGRGAVGGQQALFLVLELLVEGRARDAGLELIWATLIACEPSFADRLMTASSRRSRCARPWARPLPALVVSVRRLVREELG